MKATIQMTAHTALEVESRCACGAGAAATDHHAGGRGAGPAQSSPRGHPNQGARTCEPLAPEDRERPRKIDHRPRRAEGVTDAYVCRLLPLTCLAPDIVEAILDGRQPKGLRLAEMLGNGPLAWTSQREAWGFTN